MNTERALYMKIKLTEGRRTYPKTQIQGVKEVELQQWLRYAKANEYVSFSKCVRELLWKFEYLGHEEDRGDLPPIAINDFNKDFLDDKIPVKRVKSKAIRFYLNQKTKEKK